MCFGLSNILASFQSYINKILVEKLDILVIVYLDHILIYTEDPRYLHAKAMRWILEQLRKHSINANLKNDYFHKNEVQFLGFVVSVQSIRMKEQRIETSES